MQKNTAMKRFFYYSFLFVIIGLLTISCCDDKLINELTFKQDDLKINPYNGSEQLYFKNSNGLTKTFSSGSRTSVMETIYQNWTQNEERRCKGDYFHIEFNTTTFSSSDDSLRFLITLYFSKNSLTQKLIVLRSEDIHVLVASGERGSYFDNDTIYNNGPSWPDSSYTYHSSFDIGPKNFKNVYEFHLVAQYLSTVFKFYYSKNDGIVGYETQHQGTWYLDKIIK